MKDEELNGFAARFIPHPSSFHPFKVASLRTYPQHTLPLLPLLRSRPGGVHKASVVRSPKSDKKIVGNCRLPIPGCQLMQLTNS